MVIKPFWQRFGSIILPTDSESSDSSLQLAYHATCSQGRIRWAVIFSGLQYIIIYMPRTPPTGRPELYCSPIQTLCVRHDQERGTLASQPPLWSLLTYILLIETMNIDDDDLGQQRLGLPAPSAAPQPILGRIRNGTWRSARLTAIRCGRGSPFSLTPSSAPKSRPRSWPAVIHLDRQLSGGENQSYVYSSTTLHLVVKLATTGKSDLINEKMAYERLTTTCFTRLLPVAPRYYGAYLWYGGRALILSDEGQSLASHGVEFALLAPTERYESPQLEENMLTLL
jgi:hypothetical protein